MKLRLMGLRCTHLVSTKKPDTRAFFGLQPLKPEDSGSDASGPSGKRKAKDMSPGDLEQKYNDLLDNEGATGEPNDRSATPTDKQPDKTDAEEKWWDCPICARPQPADERRFNDHLDSCLSKQTIRDIVQKDNTAGSPPPPSSDTIIYKRAKSGGEKKQSRSTRAIDDPRQRKLCFD